MTGGYNLLEASSLKCLVPEQQLKTPNRELLSGLGGSIEGGPPEHLLLESWRGMVIMVG